MEAMEATEASMGDFMAGILAMAATSAGDFIGGPVSGDGPITMAGPIITDGLIPVGLIHTIVATMRELLT